ncbi:MAG TPA: hypothetical protein VNV86_22290, partial [Candidatus Acidoferrum sp.]|nr:hypothetical protein [Candidatus Acidoferrum sp.]
TQVSQSPPRRPARFMSGHPGGFSLFDFLFQVELEFSRELFLLAPPPEQPAEFAKRRDHGPSIV